MQKSNVQEGQLEIKHRFLIYFKKKLQGNVIRNAKDWLMMGLIDLFGDSMSKIDTMNR